MYAYLIMQEKYFVQELVRIYGHCLPLDAISFVLDVLLNYSVYL